MERSLMLWRGMALSVAVGVIIGAASYGVFVWII
jgi:hypothetical protein